MLGLALATSNAPSIYRPKKDWQAIYESQLTEGVPPPNELAQETDDVVDQYIARVEKAQQTLREQIEAYRPHVIVMLGYDDGTCFSNVQVPQFCTYTGGELTGSASLAILGEKPDEHQVTLKCNPEFAWELQATLVDRGFDMNYMSIQNPLGNPEMGTSSAFTRPASKLLAGLDIPVVPIFINCHVEPTPPGGRCYAFGQVLGQILEESPAKVAILAVGGLSHDPNGARAGWIDNRLDKFVLDSIAKGKGERLTPIFDLDSDTVRGGTAQIRTWIAAAGAAESKGVPTEGEIGKLVRALAPEAFMKGRPQATVVDYIPSLRAITGLAFAYWNL